MPRGGKRLGAGRKSGERWAIKRSPIAVVQRFYVYTLVDPRNCRPFYVGKGIGRRAWHHLGMRNDFDNPEKQKRINAIREAGQEPQVHIVLEGLREEEALLVEKGLIRAIPGLTNRTHSPVVPHWRAALREIRASEKEIERSRAVLAKFVASLNGGPCSIEGFTPEQNALYLETVKQMVEEAIATPPDVWPLNTYRPST